MEDKMTEQMSTVHAQTVGPLSDDRADRMLRDPIGYFAAERPEQAVVDEIDALVDWQLAQGESGSSMKGMNVDGGARTVAWKVPDGVGSVAVPIAGDPGRSTWCPR